MLRYRFELAILSIILSDTSLLIAQFPNLRFKHITTEQGLSNNEVTFIAQDKDGFIWIGT